MTEIQVLNSREFLEGVKRFGDALEPDLAFAFGQLGIEFEARAQDRISGAYSSSNPSRADRLQSRSGSLARDGVRHEVQRNGRLDGLALAVFITKSYGAIHEFGGEIRPVAAKALTIPLSANLDPSGLQILSAREWRATGETFIYNDHRGRGFIARKRPGEPGELDLLFILVDRVVMPPRWGLRKEWRSDSFERVRGEEVMDAIRRAGRRAG